jgi:hypothetical protein
MNEIDRLLKICSYEISSSRGLSARRASDCQKNLVPCTTSLTDCVEASTDLSPSSHANVLVVHYRLAQRRATATEAFVIPILTCWNLERRMDRNCSPSVLFWNVISA